MKWTFENAKIKGRIILTDSLHEDVGLLKDKTLYKFIWVSSGEVELDIDHQQIILKEGQLVPLSHLHHLEFVRVEGVCYTLMFNSNFYCIHGNDHEVSCNGLLFHGSSHVLTFVLSEEERRKIDTLTGIMQETCVTVTWMKLCAKLLLLTGDSVWADEIEKSAYNALYGSVNLHQNPENGGLPFDSYSPLRANKRARFIGGFQKMENGTFFYGCCAAIGAAGTGLFPNLHLLRAGNEIVLEFYTQGEIKFTLQNGHPVTIRTQTAYPYDGTIKLTVQTEEAEAFALKLRVPGYCRWSEYWIDAEPVCRAEHKETYIRLERTWNSCSSITLCLDLHPRVVCDPRPENVQSGKQFIAFCDGPIVLARDARINADVGMPVTFVPEAFRIEKSEDFGIESGGNYLVRTGRDETSRMIDYASAGATWNEASEMECWLPVQKT